MKKLIYILAFISLIAVSCTNRNECKINGTLENTEDSTMLYLADYETFKLVDSIKVVNGTFSYKMPITHPGLFLLHNKRNRYEFRDRKFLWLEPSDITINGDFNFLKSLKVNGSVSQFEFEKYNHLLDSANKRINQLKEQIHFKTEAEKLIDESKIESLKKELGNQIAQYLIAHNNSYVTLSTLHSESYLAFQHLNKEEIKSVYNNLPDDLQSTEKGLEIKKYAELPEPPKVGDMAPEIIQLTESGDTIKLTDFKGKYVLLNFWSSSCGPCRGDFKWLKKVYHKYHPQGLEIIGVSGDNNKQKWEEAINHDSIPWINISDLKGWKNEAFLLYDIKIIPNKFLINPDGLIIKDRIWLSSESITNHLLGEIFKK